MTTSKPKTPSFSLKDQLFNPTSMAKLTQQLKNAWAPLNADTFLSDVLTPFPDLGLKERLSHIRKTMHVHLPDDYTEALTILLNALPAPCDPSLTDDDFGDFIYAPFNEFVASYGCSKAHLAKSLNAIEEITTRFSAEEAIRAFINAFPDETYAKLQDWAKHPHYHVRRLVSEGTRPSLPWAAKLVHAPSWALPLLSQLHADPTRYVTRSVANHLNDISKVDTDQVVGTLSTWKTQALQQEKELGYMIRHSLRTAIKKGHAGALAMVGVSTTVHADLSPALGKSQISIGDYLPFSLEINGQDKAEKLVIDWVIGFQTKNSRISEKVFKWTQVEVSPGERLCLEKKYHFKAGMSTRSFYPGDHYLQIQVNGKRLEQLSFKLT